MRKELFIAIFLGFVLGLVITFGVWSANKAISDSQKNSKIVQNPPSSTEATPSKEVLFSLTILNPEDQSIIKTDKTTISGSTQPNKEIVVVWETGERILQTDANGNFDTDVSLIPGINEITITVFSENGEEITKTVSVVYSTEKI